MADKLKQADLKLQLASAESELQDLLNRVQALREWIAATRKLCGKKTQVLSQDLPPGVTALPRRRRTKTATLAANVIEVLRQVGHPLHVNEIVSELDKRGQSPTAKNPAATLAVALSRRPDQFERVSPNTFGLLKKQEVVENQAAS